jgi:hypothetical protein
LLYSVSAADWCVWDSTTVEQHQNIRRRIVQDTSDIVPFNFRRIFSGMADVLLVDAVSGSLETLTMPNTVDYLRQRSCNQHSRRRVDGPDEHTQHVVQVEWQVWL